MLTALVFGMGLDLSAFLAVYSAIMAGDLTSFSIGGKPKSGGPLGGLLGVTSSLGLLGEPQGLSASHNRFEHDGSPLRADLYSTYVIEVHPSCHVVNIANYMQWRSRFSQLGPVRAAPFHASRSERY
jgi:hypothetical protein